MAALSTRTHNALFNNLGYLGRWVSYKQNLDTALELYKNVEDTRDWRGFGEKAHKELQDLTGHLPSKRLYAIDKTLCSKCGQRVKD